MLGLWVCRTQNFPLIYLVLVLWFPDFFFPLLTNRNGTHATITVTVVIISQCCTWINNEQQSSIKDKASKKWAQVWVISWLDHIQHLVLSSNKCKCVETSSAISATYDIGHIKKKTDGIIMRHEILQNVYRVNDNCQHIDYSTYDHHNHNMVLSSDIFSTKCVVKLSGMIALKCGTSFWTFLWHADNIIWHLKKKCWNCSFPFFHTILHKCKVHKCFFTCRNILSRL